MFFCRSLTIPPNTPLGATARGSLRICEGVITHVWVRWYWGSGNLCGLRVLYNEFQFWPLSIGTWFPSAPEMLDFEEGIPVETEPFTLVLDGYNLDDTYPHTVWVAVNVRRLTVSENLRQLLQDLETR